VVSECQLEAPATSYLNNVDVDLGLEPWLVFRQLLILYACVDLFFFESIPAFYDMRHNSLFVCVLYAFV
jgi:hypothetical protein